MSDANTLIRDIVSKPVEVMPVVTDGTELAPKDGAAPVPTPPVEAKKEQQSAQSSRFAALAKKETALVRDRAAIKSERELIAKERAESTRLVEAQKLALSNPLKALELLGFTYKQLTEVVLNDNQPTPELREKTLEERLRADLDKKLEERDKVSAERTKADEEARNVKVLTEFKAQASQFLTSKDNQEKYPLINHPKNDLQYTVDTLSEMIKKNFYDTAEKDDSGNIVKPGILMSLSEAAKAFEEYLADITKEFYSKLQPKSDGQEKKDPSSKVESTEPRTLTNQMSTNMTTGLPAKTEADRLKRALAALG